MAKPKIPDLSEAMGATGTDAPSLIATDMQSQRFQEMTVELQQARALLMNEVLFDLSEADKARYIDTLVVQRAEVIDHWRKAEKHFFGAGRALLAIARTIPNCSLERMFNSFERNRSDGVAQESALPFSRATASRLMAAARMVEERRFHAAFEDADRSFDESMLPPYSVTCLLAGLTDDSLTTAVRSNLVRPDVTREEVSRFIASLRSRSNEVPTTKLRKELARIDKRLGKAYAEISTMRAARSQIMVQLGVVEPDELGLTSIAPVQRPGAAPPSALPVREIEMQIRSGLAPSDGSLQESIGEGERSRAA